MSRLFGGESIREVSMDRLSQLAKALDGAGEEILDRDPMELAEELAVRFRIAPVLLRSPAEKAKYHDEIDHVSDHRGPRRLKTTKVQAVIRFEGEKRVFLWRPSRCTTEILNGDLRDGALTLVIRDTGGTAESLNREFERVVNLVAATISNGHDEIEAHNRLVDAAATRVVEVRRAELETTRSEFEGLPYEIHRRAQPEVVPGLVGVEVAVPRLTPAVR